MSPLLAWYKLDGNALDSSGNGNNGTASGAYEAGKINNCIYTTTEITNPISLTDTLHYNEQGVCFGGWFKFNEAEVLARINNVLASSDYTTPTGNLLGYNSYGGIGITWHSSDPATTPIVRVTARTPTGQISTTSHTMVNDAWVHYLVNWDRQNNTLYFYVNGEQIGSSFFDKTDLPSRGFLINGGGVYAGNGPSTSLPTRIDDVRIYNHALSEKEIKELAKAKVLHYTFDTEDASDNSGYDNHADLALATTPQWTEDSRIGKGAYKFDGNYIVTNFGNGLSMAEPHTFSMWVKSNSTSESIMFFGPSNGTSQRLYFAIYKGKWDIGIGNWAWGAGVTTATTDWTLFTVVLDGSIATLYINGEISFSKAYVDYSLARNIWVGDAYGSYPFNGHIDDVRIYATALSADDIKELYNTRAQIDNKGNFFVNQVEEDEEMGQIPEIGADGVWKSTKISEIGPTNGLVAYYPLNGDAKDYASANDGTVSGATIASGINGKACYSFDGVNDYIKTDANITNGFTGLTVSVWFKPETGGSNYRCAVHKGVDSSVGGSEYWIGVSGGGFLTATIGARNGVGWAGGETTTSAVMGTWYHMTVAYDGTTTRVYINGSEAKSYALATYTPINYPTRFGASSDGTAYQYCGTIQNVRIYNRALSQEEITILYDLERGDTIKAKMDKNTLYIGGQIHEGL